MLFLRDVTPFIGSGLIRVGGHAGAASTTLECPMLPEVVALPASAIVQALCLSLFGIGISVIQHVCIRFGITVVIYVGLVIRDASGDIFMALTHSML